MQFLVIDIDRTDKETSERRLAIRDDHIPAVTRT